MSIFSQRNSQTPKEALISPEADRELLKLMIAYGGTLFVLLLLLQTAAVWINMPHSPLFPFRKVMDVAIVFVIMMPFFIGMRKMVDVRLKYARRYVAEEDWKAVFYSVEFFDHIGQKWMDSTGEAHYLLAVALERQGQRDAARKARLFVTKHRPSGEWAAKLREVEAGRAPRKITEINAQRAEAGRKLTKTKRRF